MYNQPIGIFDSGVGGLSIWQEIRKQLPHESTLFLADSLYCPYGEKTLDEIYNRSEKIIHFLLSQNAKLIVIACNTVTVTSIDKLRKTFPQIPIVGIVPVVKTAATVSKSKKIGILSTIPTSESMYQKELIEKFAHDCLVVNKGTNMLVPFVERGEIEGEAVRAVIQNELQPFQDVGVDVVALGCSHFPFLEKEMQKILGGKVTLLDSSGAVGRHVARLLQANTNAHNNDTAQHRLYTTGEKDSFEKVITALLDKDYVENTFIEGVTI